MRNERRIGSRLFMALVFLFLYAPIFVLIVFSFNSSKSRAVWTGFSLDWYRELFQDSEILSRPEHNPLRLCPGRPHRHCGRHLRRHRLLQYAQALEPSFADHQ